MTVIRPVSIGVLLVLTQLLASAPAMPVLAADSPVAAGEALLAKLASGDFDTLDEVVCAEQAEAVRAQFDPASQLGELPEGMDLEALFSSLSISIEDGAVELLSEEAEAATLRLTGTMNVSFFGMSESEIIDEEIEVVLEAGEWLVCEDLGLMGSGSADTMAMVSEDGLCAALSIDELNALGALQYDSSFSGPDSCTYQSSSLDDGFYNVGLYVQSGTLEQWQEWYPGGTDATVAGTPAYGADSQLLVALPEDEILTVAPFVDDASQPEGFDALAYATLIAEIALPRMPDVERFDFGAFEPELPVEPEPSQAIDLCEALSLEQLDALSPLQFDSVDGGADYCSYSNTDPAAGFHFVNTSLTPGSLDDFKLFFSDGQELIVADRPAYYAIEQLWVSLDEGVLSVAAFPAGSPGSEDMDSLAYASEIAAIVIAALPGLQADLATESGAGTAGASLCELVDIEAVNALGLAYEAAAASARGCDYSTSSYALRITLEDADLARVREVFPGGADLEVVGRAAYGDGRSVWVALDEGVLTVEPAFGLAEATTGLDRVAYALSVAELVLERLASAQ